MSTGRKISLIEEEEGGWSAVDEETGVTSTGATRREALANLDEAVTPRDEGAPLGDRLRGMAGDLDVDPVEAVRDIRERT